MRTGELRLTFLSDGHFYPRPCYFGAAAGKPAHRSLFEPGGQLADLPLGVFAITTPGGRLILVDAGLGPPPGDRESYECFRFAGGELPGQLAAAGVRGAEVTDLVITHLHADHHGWLTRPNATLAFPRARVWLGRDDYDYFVTGRHESMSEADRDCLTGLVREGRVELVRDAGLTRGVTLRHSPGHTPGHLTVEVRSGAERVILLGDAMTCPHQLAEPEWHSLGDVDPVLALTTRNALWRELEQPETVGVGSHFPGLGAGRVEDWTWQEAGERPREWPSEWPSEWPREWPRDGAGGGGG
jgi:glyoxylase-like metal-dependent hydrolase (beta-lactamase superfamily II)